VTGKRDDIQVGPAQSIPEVPPLRTFRVTMYDEDYTPLGPARDFLAHEAEVGGANVLRFREFMLHPQEGPINKVVACIMRPDNCWLEYTEVIPAAPSRLSLTDVSGRLLAPRFGVQ
jgi:hypothetical protein